MAIIIHLNLKKVVLPNLICMGNSNIAPVKLNEVDKIPGKNK